MPIGRPMRADRNGFAGFFEDLPVLIIVLGGVCILVASSTRISAETLSGGAEDQLKMAADSIVRFVSSRVDDLRDVGGVPFLSAVARIDLTDCAEQATLERCAFYVAIVILHPDSGVTISSAGHAPVAADRLAVSTELFNALDDSSRSLVVEIRAMVW